MERDTQPIEAAHRGVGNVRAVHLVPGALFHVPDVDAHVRRAGDLHSGRRVRAPQEHLGRARDVRHAQDIELQLVVVELKWGLPQHRHEVALGLRGQLDTSSHRLELGIGAANQAEGGRDHVDLALGIQSNVLGHDAQLLTHDRLDAAGALHLDIAAEVDSRLSSADQVHGLGRKQVDVVDGGRRIVDRNQVDIAVRLDRHAGRERLNRATGLHLQARGLQVDAAADLSSQALSNVERHAVTDHELGAIDEGQRTIATALHDEIASLQVESLLDRHRRAATRRERHVGRGGHDARCRVQHDVLRHHRHALANQGVEAVADAGGSRVSGDAGQTVREGIDLAARNDLQVSGRSGDGRRRGHSRHVGLQGDQLSRAELSIAERIQGQLRRREAHLAPRIAVDGVGSIRGDLLRRDLQHLRRRYLHRLRGQLNRLTGVQVQRVHRVDARRTRVDVESVARRNAHVLSCLELHDANLVSAEVDHGGREVDERRIRRGHRPEADAADVLLVELDGQAMEVKEIRGERRAPHANPALLLLAVKVEVDLAEGRGGGLVAPASGR